MGAVLPQLAAVMMKEKDKALLQWIQNVPGLRRFFEAHWEEGEVPVARNAAQTVDYPQTACWEWHGRTHTRGSARGVFYVGPWHYAAARVSFALAHGTLPEVVRHICDNDACVRPDHLAAGTHRDNALDMVRRGRHGMAKFTAAEVRQIRHRFAWEVGTTTQTLSNEYGVHQNTILGVISGRTYQHAGGLVFPCFHKHPSGLAPMQIQLLRALLPCAPPYRVLAEFFPVQHDGIVRIATEKSARDLPHPSPEAAVKLLTEQLCPAGLEGCWEAALAYWRRVLALHAGEAA